MLGLHCSFISCLFYKLLLRIAVSQVLSFFIFKMRECFQPVLVTEPFKDLMKAVNSFSVETYTETHVILHIRGS